MSYRFFSDKIQKHDSEKESHILDVESFGISKTAVPLQMKSQDADEFKGITVNPNGGKTIPENPNGNEKPGLLDDILPIPNLIPDGPGKGGVLFDDDIFPKLHSAELSGDSDLDLCLLGGKLFKMGSRGSSVAKIQSALVKLLPSTPKVRTGRADVVFESALPRYGVDGIFLHETHAAVVRFQLMHGLSPDGIVGKNTIKKMDSLLAPQPGKDKKDPSKGLLDLLDELRKRLGKKDAPSPNGGGSIDPDLLDELRKKLGKKDEPSPNKGSIDPDLLDELRKKLDKKDEPSPNKGSIDPDLLDDLNKKLGKKDEPNPGNDKIDPKDLDLFF